MYRKAHLSIWLVIAALGCSSSNGPGTGGGSASQINMSNFAFSPVLDTVAAGTTITWVNADNVAHTATSSSVPASAAAWDQTIQGAGQGSVTLTVPGTYEYYCRFHGSPGAGMHGTLVVQ